MAGKAGGIATSPKGAKPGQATGTVAIKDGGKTFDVTEIEPVEEPTKKVESAKDALIKRRVQFCTSVFLAALR